MKKLIVMFQAAACAAMFCVGVSAHAQTTNIIVNAFDTSDEVTGPPWGNWFGGAFVSAEWDGTSDASNNPNSGSLLITGTFTGGGQQYFAYDQNNGITPSIDGTTVTNFQCDIRFDPSSCTNPNGTFGNMAFGTRGTGFSQPSFGSFSVPATNTNWVHVSLPVNVNTQPLFATIPNVTIQLQTFGAAMTGTSKLWVDNIKFVGPLTVTAPPPPTMSVVKATPGLRMFAGSLGSIFDLEAINTVDSSQSWVGGPYPIKYSFTLLDDNTSAGFYVQMFLIPQAFMNTPVENQFVAFSASDGLWLLLTSQGGGSVTANLQWKTNLANSNPNNVALLVTNSTGAGTWTVTFNSDTNGTLTAPGATPVPFSLPADMTTRFVNPLNAYFGLQPNSAGAEGQFVDFAKISVTGVSGLNENDDFTIETNIDPGVWDFGASALPASSVLVTTNTPLWVRFTTPAPAFTSPTGNLETKADLTDTNTPWLSPQFWNGDTPVTTQMGPSFKWTLLPKDTFPTVDGTQGGAPSPKGFFRLASPPPAQ